MPVHSPAPRRSRLRSPWLVLAALVVLSTALRSWAALRVPTPWIAPDELLYGQFAQSLARSGDLAVLGQRVGFYSAVYPAFAALPLGLGDLELGYDLLRILQALAMSLTAIPVFLWGRTLMRTRWALVAAGLTLTVPGLAYSGLLMTEVLFLPLMTLAAWVTARALLAPTLANQALLVGAILLACGTRLQAFVLVPILAGAALVSALFERSRRQVTALWPAAVALGLCAAGWAVVRLHSGDSPSRLLGGYQEAGETSYGLGDATRWVLHQGGYLVLSTGFVPIFALAALAARTLLGRERDPGVRAFLAVSVSSTVWLVLQVGVFSSRFAVKLLERDLLSLAPLLFLALVLWIDRGAPWPRFARAAVALPLLLLAMRLPLERLVTADALPDSFTLVPLYHLAPHLPGGRLDLLANLAGGVGLAVFALLPRRLLSAVPLVLAVLFTTVSVLASREVADRATQVESTTVGARHRWIDEAASGDTVLLYGNDLYWNAVWETTFWNRRVTKVLDLPRALVKGPMPQTFVTLSKGGRVVLPLGGAVRAPYAVASRSVTLVGERVSANAQTALWRLQPPLRVASWVDGLHPDGSLSRRTLLTSYRCRGGTFHLSLFAYDHTRVTVRGNGRRVTSVRLGGGQRWRTSIPAQSRFQGSCTFSVVSTGPVRALRLELRRAATARS